MSTSLQPEPPRFSRRSRIVKTLALGGVPVLLFAGMWAASEPLPLVGQRVVVPYAAMMPGPMVDTLADTEDGQPVVDISGAETYPTTGELMMTTVSVGSNFGIARLFSFLSNPDMDLIPMERVVPPTVSQETFDAHNAAQFSISENDATLAAATYLGLPLRIDVASVAEGVDAERVLATGDQITQVNGQVMRNSAAVVEAVQQFSAGDEVELTIVSAGESNPTTVTVTLEALDGAEGSDGDAAPGRIGISLVDTPMGPDGEMTVDYHLSDIGGPSAGLVFSLSVVDQLSPEDLIGGTHVAGTGTISGDGQVGPIGGIRYKIIAATQQEMDVFLVPEGNCAEALAAPAEDMTLIKVTSLEDAITGLAAYHAGEQPPSCS